MAWIRTIPPEEATGHLAKEYEAAVRRAGKVYQIVQAQSLSPSVLNASITLYGKVMFAREGLERYQREMLAVVVSKANACHY